MTEDVQKLAPSTRHGLIPAARIIQETKPERARNGIRYVAYDGNELAPGELERIVQAVPTSIAAALDSKVYYFVPLAMSATRAEDDLHGANEVLISPVYSPELSEEAICHRNFTIGSSDNVFISTRLLDDRFALAFEFYINVGHAFVESAGVPAEFNVLLWEQALKDVRGETSQDAWESRSQSIIRARVGNITTAPRLHVDEKAKSEYLEAAFSDALAIYQLSLSVDFNYSELREREYPLLAAQPLAERLRLAARLFPPNPGYEFAVRYRRRA